MALDASPLVIVHGGAGSAGPDDRALPGGADARLLGVESAARGALHLLAEGGDALDAVEAAVRWLEDDPSFNAGTGACLTAVGDVELDASIMDGGTLRCGAVAAIGDVKNPIVLARQVMERSQHVLLAGPGASAFARSIGIPPYDGARLVTARQREYWERARRAGPGAGIEESPGAPSKGTVGAVARDVRGHLAAATSTGGMVMKRPGRIGDSAIIGCGTYADDALAAVSCTGHGERIIQLTLARHCADLVGRGLSAMEAAREAVRELGARVRGEGGLIVVAPRGEVGFAHNTPIMARAWSRSDGAIVVER